MNRQPPPTRKVSVHIMLRPGTDRLLSELADAVRTSRSALVEELIEAEAYRARLAEVPAPA